MKSLGVKTYIASDQGFFVISTIVYGETDAVLFDAQLLLSEAEKVAEIIKGLNKELVAIFITHAHSDHFFGLPALIKAFPHVKVYAHADVVADAQQTARKQVIMMKRLYRNLIPDEAVIPTIYTENIYQLEGKTIQIIPKLTGDIAPSTAYYIPSIETMIAGDLVYNNLHPWTLDTDNDDRKHWIQSLKTLQTYQPKIVIGGHKDKRKLDTPNVLVFMIDYLTQFNQAIEELETANKVIARMKQLFPTAKKSGMLRIGAKKNKGEKFSFMEMFSE